MKKKLTRIWGVGLVVVIVAALLFAVMPAMSPDVDIGVASPGAAVMTADMDAAMTADLTSKALVIENAAPAQAPAPAMTIAPVSAQASMPAASAGDTAYAWFALSTSLVILIIVSRRRLPTLYDQLIKGGRRINDSIFNREGTTPGRGPREGVHPAVV